MTAKNTSSAFNLPYNQSSHYWLGVFPAGGTPELQEALLAHGMKTIPPGNVYLLRMAKPWLGGWKAVCDILARHGAAGYAQVSLIPTDNEPSLEELLAARTPVRTLDIVSDSLWLGEAMLEDRLVSYMQPVFDKRNKVFGYEAFARVETGKDVISGAKIFEAGRGLGVEYVLDRHLHVKAIAACIASNLEGFLFINFVPGFIRRPEKYLEGLTDAAKLHRMPAKRIVLDFTQSETSRDLVQLKAIFDYCRFKGYSLSLDDVSSVAMAKKILEIVRPDFIKLDIALVRASLNPSDHQVITELVELAHASGVTVLAEGVETEPVQRELLRAGVDLFQGYLFSPPVAVSALKKATG